MAGTSPDGFGVNQQEVNEAAGLMSNLTSSGTEVSKALGVLDPLVFGVIGSEMGAANTSMENSVLQCLQGVLSLFSNTSSDIQAAVSNYADADGAVADTLGSIADPATPASGADEADIAALGLAAEELPMFAADSLAVGDVALGAFAEAGASAGLESSVLARLAGSSDMLAEFAAEADSGIMSLFRSLGGGPSAVSERWNGLTEDEQDAAIAADGATLGSLDGIPSEVRNLVNTDDLDPLMADTEAQIGDLRQAAVQADADHDDDEEKALLCLQQAAILQVQLDGLRALRGQLQANRDAYLLAIGTSRDGTGRCILAINNPDTAGNVVTVVPPIRTGLSEGLTGDGGYVTAAVNLAAAAREADPARPTSVVIWADYSVPILRASGAPPREPQAALILAQFQAGLYSTNVHGSALHATVIGNQAGATVIGEAAKAPGGLSADDVIALGSPGLDVNTAAGLGSPGLDGKTAAGFGSSPDSSAADDGSHVWLYADESIDASIMPGMDYFSAGSRVMPDLASVITGNYESIFYLAKL